MSKIFSFFVLGVSPIYLAFAIHFQELLELETETEKDGFEK